MVQIGVTNPIPGLSTVAVAPFLNLSAERATDGRRFALAYASELQKVPGFEVIPVGVTETAMIDAHVDLNDVDEVLKLAKVLRVDAVVVGAVTEYSPYYPPRIGLQVNWYSPRAWAFYPGIQTEPAARQQLNDWDKQRLDDYHAKSAAGGGELRRRNARLASGCTTALSAGPESAISTESRVSRSTAVSGAPESCGALNRRQTTGTLPTVHNCRTPTACRPAN